jgi:hypothetical protein
VLLLGWCIIESLRKLDKDGFLDSKFGNYNKLFYSWLFTASAHDFGYPLQVAQKLANKFSELYSKIHMNFLAHQYEELLKHYNCDQEKALHTIEAGDGDILNEIDVNKFILDGIKSSTAGHDVASEIQKFLIKSNNHGYISAMILCRSYIEYLIKLDVWDTPNDKWRIDNLKYIAAAIGIHAIPQKHIRFIENITFDLNPLSYILILVDNLQEWNRSLRPSEKWPSYILTNLDIDRKSITLSYTLTHEKWTPKMEKEVSESLASKSELIKIPQKPHTDYAYKIVANFTSNHGQSFKPLILEL